MITSSKKSSLFNFFRRFFSNRITIGHFTFSSQKTPLTHFEGHPQNRVTILLLAIICFRQVIGSNPIKYIYLQWFGTDKKIHSLFVLLRTDSFE